MPNIAAKITKIRESHTGTKSNLIIKIARMVTNNTNMDFKMAIAFAECQIKGAYYGLTKQM